MMAFCRHILKPDCPEVRLLKIMMICGSFLVMAVFENCSRNNDVFLCLSPDNDIIEATETSQIQSLSAQVQSKHVIWTKEMDGCLGKILVEQAKLGNKIDCDLESAAYMVAVTAINKRFQLDLVKEHIRNRLKTWKKQYGILSELLEQSGFGWDETRNMVVADDSAWEDYIKVWASGIFDIVHIEQVKNMWWTDQMDYYLMENSISWGKMGFFTELQLGTKSKEILEIMDGRGRAQTKGTRHTFVLRDAPSIDISPPPVEETPITPMEVSSTPPIVPLVASSPQLIEATLVDEELVHIANDDQ
ncbi:hypothetical protein CK203_046429 [Vitis vinifera]|uniref:Myb/SANT-like domain-containing protein n=1 Tax=Vitis vinifera TaxID=29760 RepID=A0A438I202_VITVI|nr:hypothetical protein CK203_046429 [Vitis vinifera]